MCSAWRETTHLAAAVGVCGHQPGRLHATIGAAFDWHGGHMHVFETVYVDFGHADRELGHRADGSATLEQVAPQVKAKFRYTYDFGDDWVHDIVDEKVLDPDPSTAYPRSGL